MQTYRDFAPTGFDARGLALPDNQDWLVVPCGRNRDSEALERANFDAALEILGGESETVEVHRFGHWACGWLEIIIVDPSRESEVRDIEAALASYPVLSDDKHSEYESEEYEEDWRGYGERECARTIARVFGLSVEALDVLQDGGEALRAFHDEHGGHAYPDMCFSYVEHGDRPNRDDVAKLLRAMRRARAK
jgi:hypothetical protein